MQHSVNYHKCPQRTITVLTVIVQELLFTPMDGITNVVKHANWYTVHSFSMIGLKSSMGYDVLMVRLLIRLRRLPDSKPIPLKICRVCGTDAMKSDVVGQRILESALPAEMSS
ncbi:hypothetical protein AVEN_63737-1 [Araneus ventricosus]|uniref:Uncharacterized protein n=1 Tax=Araneus ventricosus TaxID=182803 RepID=A0A4Y2RH75_ARAVE|nr:hypothetical protein AVEN_63737-1 [Araneus ventricosus]